MQLLSSILVIIGSVLFLILVIGVFYLIVSSSNKNKQNMDSPKPPLPNQSDDIFTK